MKYFVFERIISQPRMRRYVAACLNNTKKAMTLYRLNLKLSQELFTIISVFEISLRNAIDYHYKTLYGNNWLRESVGDNGIFYSNRCRTTKRIITRALRKLDDNYTHPKLIAEMDFGFWRYLFSQPQFYAAGQNLLRIFPDRPRSNPLTQYNHRFIFNELGKINEIRNRIAHHEPICFLYGENRISTLYAKQNYQLIKQFFGWMQIDESSLLYGIDHISQIVNKIDNLLIS